MFEDATFTGNAWFEGTTFTGNAWFEGTTFTGNATFEGATFTGNAWFGWVIFSEDARFGGAKFSEDARFGGAMFSEDATFEGATFERARKFGPVLALGKVLFDECAFSENIDIEVSANGLSCQRSKFRDGANLRIRWAAITLDDADFLGPCLLTWLPQPTHPLEIVLPGLILAPPSEAWAESKPRVMSLRRSNVASLAVSAVDLSACRFMGAHNLDLLRIEGRQQFASRPRGWRKQLGWPPVWKWTVRRALAEEHQWRYMRESGIRKESWYPTVCQPPRGILGDVMKWLGLPEDVDPLPAGDIQNIYRDLRKGREDSKDEPGAADFYYGEMEMRRAAVPRSVERTILWLYWLVSGYGLRASRALSALLLTILLFAFALMLWGMPKGDVRGFAELVVFSMQSTTSFLRAPDLTLTLPGQVFQIGLRLLGPLFFGLALFSLRGRVKR